MNDRTFPLQSIIHERTMPNGLTVLVCEDRRAPVAAVVTHVSAGYFDEPDDVAGISHVLEHMFFKGTANRGPGEIARETKELGGYLNAGTIYDRTSYYTVVPAAHVMEAIDIQADALCNSVIDAGELERELRVIIQEAKRKLDSPGAVARETLFETMFDAHRIRRWRIGTESTLARLTRDDVMRFYRAFYRAPQVVVCVAGDIEPESVFAQVADRCGALDSEPADRDRGPSEPKRTGFRFRDLEGEIRQSRLEIGWRTPEETHADSPALDLLAVIMGQGRGSRLYRAVRETGLVTQIGASNYTPDGLGVYVIDAAARREDAEPALDAITGVIDGMCAAPPAAAEMERARNIVEARLIRRFETVDAQASSLAEWQATGGWRRMQAYWHAMLDASPADVQRVAREYLDPSNATALVYRPHDAAPTAWSPSPRRESRGLVPASAPAGEFAGSAPAGTRHLRTEDGITFSRSGSLDIVVVPRPGVPLVSAALHFGGGSGEEGEAEAGLTALMARTSIKGTKHRTAAQLALQAESLGGSISPGVGVDGFDWSITLPSRHLEHGLELLADAALGATFPADETEREREAMASEAEQQREDMHGYPRRLFFEAAFEGDPYGRSLESVEEMLRHADADVVRRWYADVVTKRAPVLFAAGDIDADAAARMAGFFEHAGNGERPERRAAEWPADRRRKVVERQTAQTALVLGFPGPSRNHPDLDALRVLAAAIAGLGGSLFEELRSRRSLAYTVSAGPVARRRAGAFVAYIATSPEREDEARDGLVEHLLATRTDRLPADEIERARNYLIGTRQIRLQTTGARLAEVAGAVLQGQGLAELREHEARIRAVSADAIRDAAGRWFDETRIVEGIVRGTGRSR